MRIIHNMVVIGGLLLLSCGASKNRPNVELWRHPGLQWLSWSSDQREAFVYGYIEGHGYGMNEACLAADNLFEKDKPHALGQDNVPSTFPSARCRANVPQYLKVKIDLSRGADFSAYTSAITEFYRKHPEHRDTPFTQLMEYMPGTKSFTADDLYSSLGNH